MGEKRKTLPRYSIIGPPFISSYAIADDWADGPGTQILEPRYADSKIAGRDCAILNKAQAILCGDRLTSTEQERRMAETREFPTAVIASIATGTLLCDFSAMHEAAEFLMGHPIWTHHFADKELCETMRRTIAEQCPGMPLEIEGVTKENYKEKVAALEAEIGPTQRIRKGGGLTAMLPTDGIPDHVQVIQVRT